KDLDPILQPQNAHSHTSYETQEALLCLQFKEVLPHPLYSHSLATCDFHLFPKMKEHLKGHHFHSDDKVKGAIQSWCQPQPPEFLSDRFA
ncbi:hypothetical protein JRQ81_019860, partial [Phrynocephalus forsythii]